MVYFTGPSEKSSLETVGKRAGTFKQYLAGDWMKHLSITVLPGEAAGFATVTGLGHWLLRHQNRSLNPDMLDFCMILWSCDIASPAASQSKQNCVILDNHYSLETNFLLKVLATVFAILMCSHSFPVQWEIITDNMKLWFRFRVSTMLSDRWLKLQK